MAMTENDKIVKYGVIVCHVQSRTESDAEPYKIRLKDGIHHCNCKGWIFSKEVPKSCKHIKAFLKENGKTQKVAELNELQIVEKCLKTAGLYDIIRQAFVRDIPVRNTAQSLAESNQFRLHLARLAQALLPHFNGQAGMEAISISTDIRLIYLED